MYKFNKIVILIFTLLFLISVTFTSKAETYTPNNYTSLGDSTAYGMSASHGNGYVDLFYKYLKSQEVNSEMNLYNLAIPGTTSSDLLSKLKSDSNTKSSIKNAKIITISVGGYNLLSPILVAACKTFQLDPESSTLVKDLEDKIKADTDKAKILLGLISSPSLQSALILAAMQFGLDWPQIITEIKKLSPTAKVYAMTIYNPISTSDSRYSAFDLIVQLMNKKIEASASDGKYKIVDVYSAFKEYKDKDPLVNFSLSSGNFDPHPTNKGHEVISQACTKVVKMLEVPTLTKTPIPAKSKDTTITSSKYKIDKVKLTIAIGNSKIALNTFKSNIKVAKGATYSLLKADGKTAIVNGSVIRGMIVRVKAEDKKTFKLYKIIIK